MLPMPTMTEVVQCITGTMFFPPLIHSHKVAPSHQPHPQTRQQFFFCFDVSILCPHGDKGGGDTFGGEVDIFKGTAESSLGGQGNVHKSLGDFCPKGHHPNDGRQQGDSKAAQLPKAARPRNIPCMACMKTDGTLERNSSGMA